MERNLDFQYINGEKLWLLLNELWRIIIHVPQ